MSKVRVHQLAKQLEIEPRDLIAQLEKIRIRGKKPQSSLDESEIEAVKAAIAATEKPKVTVARNGSSSIARSPRKTRKWARCRRTRRWWSGVSAPTSSGAAGARSSWSPASPSTR